MKKLAYLFAGMAAFGLCSCSSDEPSNPEGNIAKGDVAYLNVNIIAGDNNSRGGSNVGEGTDFIYGNTQENFVENAYFYFFDDKGNYVLESNVWNGGTAGTAENIEILGKNTVVLTGLTGKKYPKWVVTVLNKPSNVTASVGTTLNQFSKQLVDCYHMNGSNKRFVMSTTSYFGDDNEGCYFATKLNEDNFSTTPDKNFEEASGNTVAIYVERLAAAVEVYANVNATSNEKQTFTDGSVGYKLKVSLAGAENSKVDPNAPSTTPMAAEEVYIKFLGWDLNATAKKSYVSKDLGNWTKETNFGGNWAYANAWNHADYHRSYWGQSTTYGKKDEVENLNLTSLLNVGDKTHNGGARVATSALNSNSARLYCNETTNDIANITVQPAEGVENSYLALPNATPTVLLKAQICDKDGNGLDIVNFHGINYLLTSFENKVLEIAKNQYGLNAWKQTFGAEYEEIGISDLDIITNNSDGKHTGAVKLKVKDGTYYKKEAEGNFSDTETATINAALEEVTKNAGDIAIAYTEGATYYAIPIEHLNNPTGVSSSALNKLEPVEGQYGVVRNHIYSIGITKISSLGNGVFDPENEKLNPITPKDPTYYLESQINILSWKVVSQGAEI